MSLEVEIVPCLKDNYAYLVSDAEKTLCAVVDPSEAAPVTVALKGRALTHILNTHHHGDHTGGNLALKARYGAIVVGPAKDRDRIAGIDIGVDEAGWRFGPYAVRILEVPGHTRGAITFVTEGRAFTGDTLFSLGCGRMFEGTAETMWASLEKLMGLPDATLIYCGHEYTENNGRFALTLEPGNDALRTRTAEVAALRARARPSVPSTMAMEKATNPFLRPNSPEIRKKLAMDGESEAAVFAEIRARKDHF